jgi:DNA-binding XRE family transcriptional regulator
MIKPDTKEQRRGRGQERGWSQTELADRIGVDPSQISRYEQGRITPSADVIVRFAEAFNVSTDYLLVDDAARRPSRAATTPSATGSPPIPNSHPTTSSSSCSSSTHSSPRPGSRSSPAGLS